MLISRLNTWLGRWLAIVLMMIALPVFAQQGETPPVNATNEMPAYSTLADLLENDQARQRLIEELRALADPQEGELGLAGEETPAAIAEQAPSDQSAEQVSLARRLAAATSNIAGNIGSQFTNLATALGALIAPDDDAESDTQAGPEFDMAAFTSAAIELALVIVATFAAFFILRRLARPLFTRLSHWSMHGDSRSALLRVIVAVALAATVDVAVVALAYIGGNLLATFAVGGSGELPTYTALFLNAFLIVELFKAAIRMLFSSGYEGLRLLPISADEASSWNRWLANLSGFVGYGMLVLVPIVNFNVSPALGQATGLVVMLLAFIYATTFVLKNRLKLRGALEVKAANAGMGASRIALVLLGKCWHLLAIAYFVLVLVLGVTKPEEALPYVMLATLQTLIIVGVGLLISGVLTQIIGKRIRLSDDLRRKLPKLEKRLNSYIPTFLKVIRAIILVVVVMLVLNAWGVFDLAAWYATEAGRGTVSTLIDVILILIVAVALWIALASFIEHRLTSGTSVPSARTQTLGDLFRKALAIVLATITAMIVLAEIGVNIGPLIASAGVLGLAIGFGAQKMVQDVITGVFIQVENAMNIGDVVTAGSITGTAERLSIRSVGIRDLAGTYHIIPFSSVDIVSNYMRGFGNHVGEYGISYRENIDEAIAQLELAFEELKASDEHGHKLLEPLSVAGVIALADNSVNIRVILKTTPGDQWGVGRAYNRLVKMYFDAAGIEIPFPHTTLYFGQDKTGSAPPANLRIMQQDFTIDGSPAGQPKTVDKEPHESLDRHDDTAIPKAHTQPDRDNDEGEGR